MQRYFQENKAKFKEKQHKRKAIKLAATGYVSPGIVNRLLAEQNGLCAYAWLWCKADLILRPELMPSKAARQEWQYDQEVNLQYVAATRAKDTLIYVADEDMTIDAPRRGEG